MHNGSATARHVSSTARACGWVTLAQSVHCETNSEAPQNRAMICTRHRLFRVGFRGGGTGSMLRELSYSWSESMPLPCAPMRTSVPGMA
eukprot:1390543-Rhodomonas_salina.1